MTDGTGAARSAEQVAARLTDLVRELTGRDVGPDDNFFDAGLTSMTVARLRTLVQRRLGVSLPVVLLFEHPTITSAAARIAQAGDAPPPVRPPTPERRTGGSRREIRDRIRRGEAG